MDQVIKVAAGSIAAVIIITTLRSHNKEMALVLSIVACVVVAIAGITMLNTAMSYVEKIQEVSQMKSSVLAPLFKVCAITTLTQFTATFCQEAGVSSVGKIVEMCGGVASLCAIMPLCDSALKLVESLLGG